MTHIPRPSRFASHVRVSVQYRDESVFGGAVSSKLQDNMKRLCSPIYRAFARHGAEYVVREGDRLLNRSFSSELFRELCGAEHPGISSDVLFPKPDSILPRALVLTSTEIGQEIEIEVEPEQWSATADWVAEFSGAKPHRRKWSPQRKAFNPPLDELVSRGLLIDDRTDAELTNRASDVTFIGHNTVAVRSKNTIVVVDPWFFPKAKRFPSDNQPIVSRELGFVDAAMITHSHPDHFDPGSLLMLGRETQVIVPAVPRESILSVDIKSRLRKLGFASVTELAWWKSIAIGDIQVTALPFHGEQPTSGKRLHSEVRNWGNCYLVKSPRVSCAFVADSGSDLEGSVGNVASEAFDRYGPIDVLFSGYRGWSLYPIQYFESSIRQYLLFVPPESYSVRQTIMNSVDEAINTAEAWHAAYLAPYGNGGAPWHEEIGLGPKQNSTSGHDGYEWIYFDPPPEMCLKALSARSQPLPNITVGSPVKPLLLRPGQSVKMVRGQPILNSI